MNFFSDIDATWKGNQIRVKEGHPRANETATFQHTLNGPYGFGLVFKSDEGKDDLFIQSRDLDFIEIINKNDLP
jgi:hypothetical protein